MSRTRSRPDTTDEAPPLTLQAFNLHSPIERPNPSFSIEMRNQTSGRGSSCSVSSLKFALPHREQAAAFSHSPRQGVWLQTKRLLRPQTFVPHSQDSRLPSVKGAAKRLATRGENIAGMGRVVVPRRRTANGRAARRGVLRVRKPGTASVGVISRTQPVVLSRQGRLNEVRCLEQKAQPRADETEQELPPRSDAWRERSITVDEIDFTLVFSGGSRFQSLKNRETPARPPNPKASA